MTLVSTVCRYLLGLLFTVYGANGFLHLIPIPPPATPSGMQFHTATTDSHFMLLVFALELLAGISLLIGRFVLLALVVLAAILANIVNYHITMDPAGFIPGIVALVLWFGAAWNQRARFRLLFSDENAR